MYPFKHFLWAYFIGVALMFFYSDFTVLPVVLFILGSTLIDVDHYLYYVYKKKDWSLINAYNWFIQQSLKPQNIVVKNRLTARHILIFHGIEALAIVLLLGLWIEAARYIFLGMLLHIILDWVVEVVAGVNILYSHKISQIKNWVKNKRSR